MEDSSLDEQPRHLDLIDLVWKIMEDEGELELFFAIAWNIWHARNQRRMGEQESHCSRSEQEWNAGAMASK